MQFGWPAARSPIMLLQLQHRVQAGPAIDDRAASSILADGGALDDDRLIGQALNTFYEEICVVRIDLMNAGGQSNDTARGSRTKCPLQFVERGNVHCYRRSME